MVETTILLKTGSDSGDREIIYCLWPLENVKKDLLEQGGLEGCLELPFIDETKRKKPGEYEIADNYFADHSTYLAVYDGTYNGIRFRMRWKKDEFLTLMSEQRLPELIDAFSKVVGYKPFVEYKFVNDFANKLPLVDNMPFTVELCRENSDERYIKLKKDEQKKDLRKL